MSIEPKPRYLGDVITAVSEIYWIVFSRAMSSTQKENFELYALSSYLTPVGKICGM